MVSLSHTKDFLSQLGPKMAHNWKSALSVALISIPLSLSLALASLGPQSSNAPLIGLITAVWGCGAAALFASSKQNVYGPAGALSGIILAFCLLPNGGAQYIPLVTLVTGVFVFLFWALKITRYLLLIPSSAVHGFLLGTAFIILSGQLSNAFGIKLPVHKEAYLAYAEGFQHIMQANPYALGLFVGGFAFLLIWKKLVPALPGAIPVTFLGIALSFVFGDFLQSVGVKTIATQFPSLTFSLSAFDASAWFAGDSVTNIERIKNIVQFGFMLAVIAVIETLIAGKIAENISKTKFDRHKEVFGLSISNIVSGLVGGLPTTAVLVRTAINAKSGANSRISAFMAAVFVLLISAFVFSTFTYLPMPIIAAILANICVGMVEIHLYKELWVKSRSAFFLTMMVAVITIFDDPIVGLLAGTAVAILMHLKKVSEGQAAVTVFRQGDLVGKMTARQCRDHIRSGDCVIYKFGPSITYLNAEMHAQNIAFLRESDCDIILSFSQVHTIDIDGYEFLEALLKESRDQKRLPFLAGDYINLQPFLESAGVYSSLVNENKIVAASSIALQRLQKNTDQ